MIISPRTRKIYLLICTGAILSLLIYAKIAYVGGQYLILAGLIMIFIAVVGIVFALREEMRKAGKGGPCQS